MKKILDSLYPSLIAGLLLAGCSTSDIAGSRNAQRPNVLLIMCDDLNDYSGAFGGHPQVRTPNIDKLAASSVVFDNAHSNTPICSPSRNSLFTGVYSHVSKDFGWTPHDEQPVLKHNKLLMELFRENGYLVAGSGKLLHNDRKHLWDDPGVDINNYGPFAFDGKETVGHPSVPEPFRTIGPVDGSFAPLSDVPKFPEGQAGPAEPGWVYSPKGDRMSYTSENERDLTPDEMHAQWAAAKIRELEERESDQPFFLGVGFVRPHTPLYAPKRFFDMFPLEDLKLEPLKEGDAADTHYLDNHSADLKGPRYYRTLKESYPDIETGLKHFLQAYLACVTFVDEQIGIVLDALDKSSFKDNTIVVFTSDHGWNMGEKEYLFKNSPWEESTRVPFIIRAPGEGTPGATVSHPVSLIDIFPTLVDLCGLEGETIKSEGGAPLGGFSIRPFLENPDYSGWNGPAGAFTVLGVGPDKEDIRQQTFAYRTKDWRYILYPDGSEELYSHQADPYEWNNLAKDPAHTAKKQELREQMMAIIEGR